MPFLCRENLHDDVYEKIAETRNWAIERMEVLADKFGDGLGKYKASTVCVTGRPLGKRWYFYVEMKRKCCFFLL
jgi:hypothetical protein